MPELDEQALVLQARQGNMTAFGALVRLHQGRIRGFVRRLSKDHALADDLAQECFVQAWRKLGDFRGLGSFNAWLCSIAYRAFLQTQRSRRREDTAVSEYEVALADLAEEQTPRSDRELRALEQAMLQLRPEEAAAITLHVTLGYSHGDVASILDLPLGSVKSLISRGLPKLREALTTSDAGDHHEDR